MGRTKYFARFEADRVRIFRLKKGPRQCVTILSKLYRTDEPLMVRDTKTDDVMVFYNVDETQPLMPYPVLVDPDETIALMDSAKAVGNKKAMWAYIGGSNMWQYFTAIIIVGALLYGFLAAGGL